MSVQFKIKDSVGEERRREIIDVLDRAGLQVRNLYPGQRRASLASIFTVPRADDATTLRAALAGYRHDIEYVEAAPRRSPKS